MRQQMIAVRDAAPFSLGFEKDRIEVEAGKKTEIKIQLARLWPDFKNPVNVIPLSMPGPIKVATISVPEGKTEAMLTIDVGANLRPGDYTIALMGQAQVPFAKDPKAISKPNTLVSLPSRPVTLVVRPGKK